MDEMCEETKMNKKALKKHYNNILNFPDLAIHPERTDDLKNEIQRVADIDNIPYRIAVDIMCDDFVRQDLEADPDDDNSKKIDTATTNLRFLRHLEGLDVTNY